MPRFFAFPRVFFVWILLVLLFVTFTDTTVLAAVSSQEHHRLQLFSLGFRKALKPIVLGYERASQSPFLARNACHWISNIGPLLNEHPRSKSRLQASAVSLDGLQSRGGQVKVKTKKTKKAKPHHHHHHHHKEKKKHKVKHESALSSSSECFVPLEDIADMTLRDVGTVFDYAVKSTRIDYKEETFLSDKPPRIKSILGDIESATSKSRGKNVKPALTGVQDAATGDIDAFHFCAAMRILSEWRLLRQVPEGNQYKHYAAGMKLARKDVLHNIHKIENAAHHWMDHRSSEDLRDAPIIRGPTLRDILQYETDTGVHEKLPKLKDGTGSMGILWNRRGLNFHADCFEKLLQVPQKFSTSKDAIVAAYNEIVGGYHGWALKKVFLYSFKEAPEDIDDVYKSMNPHHLKEVIKAGRHLAPATSRSVKQHRPKRTKPPEKFAGRLGWEVMKCIESSGQCYGPRLLECYQKPFLVGDPVEEGEETPTGEGLKGEALDHYVADEMKKDAHEHILSYLEVTKPLLRDLAGLFSEFNMDDPTKV